MRNLIIALSILGFTAATVEARPAKHKTHHAKKHKKHARKAHKHARRA